MHVLGEYFSHDTKVSEFADVENGPDRGAHACIHARPRPRALARSFLRKTPAYFRHGALYNRE